MHTLVPEAQTLKIFPLVVLIQAIHRLQEGGWRMEKKERRMKGIKTERERMRENKIL